MPPISVLHRELPQRAWARNQLNCEFPHAAMAMAEPVRQEGPRAHPSSPRTNWSPCEIGYWARLLVCNRVRVRPTGRGELLRPRIGLAQKMQSCWRKRLKQGY